LVRICFGDYDRDLALVAEAETANGSVIVGVGRMNRVRGSQEAEVAILVTDSHQNRGLGAELLRRVIHVAREEGIHAVSAEMMADNLAMQSICKHLGFKVKMQDGFASMRARLEI
jgi:acetyltransferase